MYARVVNQNKNEDGDDMTEAELDSLIAERRSTMPKERHVRVKRVRWSIPVVHLRQSRKVK